MAMKTAGTKTLDRRAVLALAGAGLTQALLAQKPVRGAENPTLFQHDLPDINLHNWELTAREIRYEPGATTAAHRHPGITIVYVLEGAVVSKVGIGPEKTYNEGEMFMETPGELHAISRNASATKPARFLAILMAEKGAQSTVQV